MWADTLNQNKKLIGVAIGILLIAVIGYLTFIAVSRSGKLPVTINAVPSDASITIDGKKTSGKTAYVTPGSHEFKATKDGFTAFKASHYIDHENQVVTIPLSPESKEATKWAQDNQALYTQLEGVASQAANDQGQAFEDKNPITSLLPFNNYLYTIGYHADPSDPSGNSIIIDIDAADGYRQSALNQLYQWGYDPTNFTINFNNYKNPFTS